MILVYVNKSYKVLNKNNVTKMLQKWIILSKIKKISLYDVFGGNLYEQ